MKVTEEPDMLGARTAVPVRAAARAATVVMITPGDGVTGRTEVLSVA